ncbi:MAG: DNA repair protein RecN [Rhizobiaceae bacterium]
MLSRLSIRDIVLVSQLDMDFSSGLTVLTGETGAGKSILLDALSLALGARGDGSLVRSGCNQGVVIAVFDISGDQPVQQLLQENAIAEDETLILRRVQGADGRTKAFINDSPVSASFLRDLGQRLVEIHGQHDDRALINTNGHKLLVDAFGDLEADRELLKLAWNAWRSCIDDHDELKARLAAGEREAEFLRASVEELSALAPEPGEETTLAERRSLMMKSEKLATDLSDAIDQLSGGGSPIPQLSTLVRKLERKAADVPGLFDNAVEALDGAVNGLHVAQQELETAAREIDFDAGDLERVEERLFALRAASRKFSVPVEELPDLAVRMADNLAAMTSGEEELAALARRVGEMESEYFRLAGTMSGRRSVAAQKLTEMVEQELPALKLEQARFTINMESSKDKAGPDGMDFIEFWVQTNPGTNPGPILKVASGGELSRFLLALKVALANKASAPTLIFDEIDTGAGGAVADAIGKRLGRLAQSVQVLSVTHAPQVAARAQNHFRITKQSQDQALETEGTGTTSTVVDEITDAERREEIARMLAGATITEEARAAADQLINHNAA